MPGKSSQTTVVTIRLPNNVMNKIKKRCSENRYDSVSAYLRDRITYDITRKHQKVRK